jgi:hypothetical protein
MAMEIPPFVDDVYQNLIYSDWGGLSMEWVSDIWVSFVLPIVDTCSTGSEAVRMLWEWLVFLRHQFAHPTPTPTF